MEVILLERVEKLGGIGDVVTVKNGFARNYLLPRNKALRANEANRKVFEANRERIEAQNAERRATAEKDSKKIDGAKVQLIRQASNTGQLYGSVSTRDISEIVTADMLHLWYDAGARAARETAIGPERRARTFDEVVHGLDAGAARYESQRCLSCGNCFECDGCFGACPEEAIIKLGKGNRYEFNYELCTGCGVCYEQCPCHAIDMIAEPAATV